MEKRRERKHVVLSPHAMEKIARLQHLGITEGIVNSILLNPRKIEASYLNRKMPNELSVKDTLFELSLKKSIIYCSS